MIQQINKQEKKEQGPNLLSHRDKATILLFQIDSFTLIYFIAVFQIQDLMQWKKKLFSSDYMYWTSIKLAVNLLLVHYAGFDINFQSQAIYRTCKL